jgi:hypothetical protein
MKRSGEDLSESLSHLPEKAGGALSTAAEIVSGVAGHLVHSTGDTLANIRDHRDPRAVKDLEAKVQVRGGGQGVGGWSWKGGEGEGGGGADRYGLAKVG